METSRQNAPFPNAPKLQGGYQGGGVALGIICLKCCRAFVHDAANGAHGAVLPAQPLAGLRVAVGQHKGAAAREGQVELPLLVHRGP